MKHIIAAVAAAAAAAVVKADNYNFQYNNPAQLPAKVDSTQTGFNDCQKRYGASNQKAECVNLYINSIKDFCIYAPRYPNSVIGNEEENVVSWCLKSGYGTRLIPDGTIQGAHFLKTPEFLQVTGVGDFTKTNIKRGDEGGELDPHGATGHGNPRGGLVFTRALNGNFQRLYEWQHFISYNEFCLRACIPGQYDTKWCPHIYDVMGCYWNEPANYDRGSFDACDGTSGEWPGVYRGSTFYQGNSYTPPAQTPGSSSNCRKFATVSTGAAVKTPARRRRDVLATSLPEPRAVYDELDA